MLRRHIGGAADAVLTFDHAAIDAEIVGARLRITRHPDSGRDERRGIEAGGGDEMGEPIDATREMGSAMDDLLHRCAIARNHMGRKMLALRARPGRRYTVGLDA